MGDDLEDRIRASWSANAAPWTVAVRSGAIPSRVDVTDAAIEAAVTSLAPARVLDLGCGEGWLARRLARLGIDVVGVDAEEELVAAAAELEGGVFHNLAYDRVTADSVGGEFDAVVANFSLLGRESVAAAIATVPALLSQRGSLVVQTLHPHGACGDAPYADGWREGSWDGFSGGFRDPAPWYFRTMESWIALIVGAGLRLTRVTEPTRAGSSAPASLLLVAERVS